MLVTVPDIPALLQLRAQCDREGIDNRLFIEEDLGFVPTALATAPVNGKARKLFRELRLFNPCQVDTNTTLSAGPTSKCG